MTYIKPIEEMLLLQQKLNDETNGTNWETGITKDGKLISWKRCIYMECAELVDSFAWKHWKAINKDPNLENVTIEIVDIWHFIMSLGLENYHTNKLGDIHTLAIDISSCSGFSEFYKEAYNIKEYNIYEIINDIEVIINRCSGFDINFFDLLKDYFRLSLKCGVNLSKLFEVYMGKNVLNKFRQDHGYKAGTYNKNWNGKEDNEVMSQILESGINSMDEIYAKLKIEYSKVK
ncbi:dUTPase [Campylobacter fetus]|uniref:dUTPase n=1 Tax=Campylobacter fetus TaxID=196 RepID=UPI000FCB383E|nr:dUTP diphosphatase [Campylobacter fetus]QQF52037.1 dUTPase [Campylobacter fetus subsp. venerealis]RUT51609.1 dUTPase [Campylobacter fetus]RUT52338.1 dUTPase [Campylobacter fetus]